MAVIFNTMLIFYVLIGVFFFTLLERKILGLIQFRLGPNKVMLKGVFQALSDAMKLLGKSLNVYILIDLFEYNFMPIGMLGIMLMLWSIFSSSIVSYYNNILLMVCLLSLGVYPIMFGGWFSGSLYSMLGSLRSIAQMISYEVSFIMIILSLIIFTKSFSLDKLMILSMFWLFILNMMLFASILIELNRTPIDLVEGESELVSGFNTEYYGFKFAMIFLAEYGMIMFMSGLFILFMLGLDSYSVFWGGLTLLVSMVMILIRGVLPRIRYDKLMEVCWVSMLWLSVGVLVLNFGIFSLFYKVSGMMMENFNSIVCFQNMYLFKVHYHYNYTSSYISCFIISSFFEELSFIVFDLLSFFVLNLGFALLNLFFKADFL